MRLKKGSPEAKAHMARLRSMVGLTAGSSRNPSGSVVASNPLVRGDQLTSRQVDQVLSAFIYRWTTGNAARARVYNCPVCKVPGGDPNGGVACRQYHPTIPLVSDNQWLKDHAFYFLKDGRLDPRKSHAEPEYMAKNPLTPRETSEMVARSKHADAVSHGARRVGRGGVSEYYSGRRDEASYVVAAHGSSRPVNNPPRARAGAERALDKQIEQAYYRHAQGVQVSIMDIPKIFRDIKLELAGGVDLDTATVKVVSHYRTGGEPVQNPPSFIVIESDTGSVVYTKKATGMGNEAIAACVVKARQLADRNGKSYIVFLDVRGYKVGHQLHVGMVRALGITEEVHPTTRCNPVACNNPGHGHRRQVRPNPLLQTVGLIAANPGKSSRGPGLRPRWVNPLTEAESADILRSAKHDTDAAKSGVLGRKLTPGGSVKLTRRQRDFYAGRGTGKAIAVRIHGPARAVRPADTISRRGYKVGMKNPPLSSVWDRLTHGQRQELLEIAGVIRDSAETLCFYSWSSLRPNVKVLLEKGWEDTSRRRTGGTTRIRQVPVVVNVSSTRASRRGLVLANNPPTRIPWRKGQRIPVEKARAWVKSTGNAELIREFEAGLKLQTEANKHPEYVEWMVLPMGSKNRIDSVTSLVQYGTTDETIYKPPAGSKKGNVLYRHKWGEGSGRRRAVPLLATATGRTLIMPLGTGQKARDWLRG